SYPGRTGWEFGPPGRLSIHAHRTRRQAAYGPAIASERVMAQPPPPPADPGRDGSSDPCRAAMARSRRHLIRCWCRDCDIDPMILRLRQLRHQGSLEQARCLEQELLPLF
ncbi:MAG: hypothetical protein ACK5E6_00040, partial [Cyanobacteriota bacterium]